MTTDEIVPGNLVSNIYCYWSSAQTPTPTTYHLISATGSPGGLQYPHRDEQFLIISCLHAPGIIAARRRPGATRILMMMLHKGMIVYQWIFASDLSAIKIVA
jgi:hypothetical protein